MTSPSDKFEFGTRIGILVSVVASLLSALSVSVVLCYTGTKLVKKFRARRAIRKLHANINLPPIDVTDSLGFVGLMFVELIQAVGGLLNIRWVGDGFITEDALCTAQGHLKQIGSVGVALFSLFIAFDTFFVLVFGWRASRMMNFCALAGLCLFIVMVAVIGVGIHHTASLPFYGNTKFWCWIRPEYKTERLVLEYLWMWLAAFLMLILYGIIALVMRGLIIVEGKKIRLRNRNDAPGAKELGSDLGEEERENQQVANMMLFYPAVYIICVLPLSVVRWLDFSGHPVSPNAFIGTVTVFSLTGFFDVLLFKFTRPALVSCQNLDPPSHPDLPDLVSTTADTESPSGATLVTRRAAGMGTLPDDVEMTSPHVSSPNLETPATRYAQMVSQTMTAMNRPLTASTSGTRPRTQESSRPGSRDSALSPRPGWNEDGLGRATGLGHLPE